MKKNKLNTKEAIYFILFNSITASLVSTYILQFHKEYFFKRPILLVIVLFIFILIILLIDYILLISFNKKKK